MFSAVLTMLLVFAIVCGIGLVVAVGIGGRGRRDRFSAVMSRVAAHLNGEAEPPRMLFDIMR